MFLSLLGVHLWVSLVSFPLYILHIPLLLKHTLKIHSKHTHHIDYYYTVHAHTPIEHTPTLWLILHIHTNCILMKALLS